MHTRNFSESGYDSDVLINNLNSQPLKILQICHRVPFPPIDGGNIVMMNSAIGLADYGNDVYQFAINTKKHFTAQESIPKSIRDKVHFSSSLIDTKITLQGALKNFFTSDSYNVIRFYSESVEEDLKKILDNNQFDIVQLETLFASPYIPCIRKHSNAKIVLRAHNVEHVIWERLALHEKNFLKKRYIQFLASRLKKCELDILQEIEALIPITSVDESMFKTEGFKKPMLTLPMSLDIEEYPINSNVQVEIGLFHLGSMDWLPNLEGVKWFLDNCWAEIHKLNPELKLFLAGRSFPNDIIAKNYPNTFCEGRIEKAVSYMGDKQIMIVPLHSGSGMRVKIIQGMALGKTIISTTIGAEGIPVENEKNILIADTPKEFINQVKRCVENPDWCRKIGNSGRKLVEENYSNESVARKLTEFYQQLNVLR
jgi:glycosyltransferase involved in cell wall biosynthesis